MYLVKGEVSFLVLDSQKASYLACQLLFLIYAVPKVNCIITTEQVGRFLHTGA
jgi:hypothetical protein